MARLRRAYVEHRQCGRPDCGAVGLGDSCEQCGDSYRLDALRVVKEQLIMVDVQPPLFEREERWHCTARDSDGHQCEMLIEPPNLTDLADTVRRCDCGAEFFSAQERDAILGVRSLAKLTKARRLDALRKSLQACAHCGRPPPQLLWCPRCFAHSTATGGLPMRPTWVYVRSTVDEVLYEDYMQAVGPDGEPQATAAWARDPMLIAMDERDPGDEPEE